MIVMGRILLLISLATLTLCFDRGGLLPLSMKRKLCDREPKLRICKEMVTVAPVHEAYSKWIVCESRPDLPLCKHHPLRARQEGEENEKLLEAPILEVPVDQKFSDARPHDRRSIENEIEKRAQLVNTVEFRVDEDQSFEPQPFEMDETIFP